MKFVVVFAALLACAAAQPDDGPIFSILPIGSLPLPVTTPSGILAALGITVDDIKQFLKYFAGLLDQIADSGAGQLIKQLLDILGNVTGLKGLGCLVGDLLVKCAECTRDVDALVTGLVCDVGKATAEILRPIIESLGESELNILLLDK